MRSVKSGAKVKVYAIRIHTISTECVSAAMGFRNSSTDIDIDAFIFILETSLSRIVTSARAKIIFSPNQRGAAIGAVSRRKVYPRVLSVATAQNFANGRAVTLLTIFTVLVRNSN